MQRLLCAGILAGSAGLWLGGCGTIFGTVVHGTQVKAVPHESGKGLTVKTFNGSIHVVGGGGASSVSIQADIRAGGRTEADAKRRLQAVRVRCERVVESRLVVEVVFPEPRQARDGASFRITIPDAYDVELHSSNGRIHTSGLSGKLIARTSNGALDIEHGDGALVLGSSNGSITARCTTGPAELTTSNGALRLETTGAGPAVMKTSNGSIRLSVGKAFRGRLDAKTSNGKITVDDRRSAVDCSGVTRTRGTLVFDASAVRSHIETSNGSVTIRVD
ncbi:MAG: DUF4097 family beta strand repeat protein [Planctomycetes bacterium]|nr:DUF4097 family beta strand repeat protein [Planctomycetota bacterium]